jgi:hypothetical protein
LAGVLAECYDDGGNEEPSNQGKWPIWQALIQHAE